MASALDISLRSLRQNLMVLSSLIRGLWMASDFRGKITDVTSCFGLASVASGVGDVGAVPSTTLRVVPLPIFNGED